MTLLQAGWAADLGSRVIPQVGFELTQMSRQGYGIYMAPLHP